MNKSKQLENRLKRITRNIYLIKNYFKKTISNQFE